jgi:hypothetical protein
LNINEAIDILFSGTIINFNNKAISELEKKKEEYNKQNKLFDKYFNFFVLDYQSKTNQEIFDEFCEKAFLEKELDFVNKFNSFDKIFSDIITDKININDAKIKFDEIKEIIFSTVNNANKNIYSLTKSLNDMNLLYENTCLEESKLIFILKFMEKQQKIFKDEQNRIFEEYKQTLDDVISKTIEINELVKKYYTFKNQSLIEMWKESNPPFSLEYCEINNLKKILKELVTSVKLDLNYSFDEKFVYWSIKNGFSDYFK